MKLMEHKYSYSILSVIICIICYLIYSKTKFLPNLEETHLILSSISIIFSFFAADKSKNNAKTTKEKSEEFKNFTDIIENIEKKNSEKDNLDNLKIKFLSEDRHKILSVINEILDCMKKSEELDYTYVNSEISIIINKLSSLIDTYKILFNEKLIDKFTDIENIIIEYKRFQISEKGTLKYKDHDALSISSNLEYIKQKIKSY